jgi:hypothetical protein
MPFQTTDYLNGHHIIAGELERQGSGSNRRQRGSLDRGCARPASRGRSARSGGHHVLRIYCTSLVARMYEKFGTFLRIEVCVHRLQDVRLVPQARLRSIGDYALSPSTHTNRHAASQD